MIKLNLLPSYIAEFRRMKIYGVVFAVLFLIEAGVFLGWQSGLKAQTKWFGDDKQRCETLTKSFQDYKSNADTLKTNSEVYTPWLSLFWDLQPTKDNVTKLTSAMEEAAKKLGGDGSAYESFTISADGNVKAQGRIHSSLRFLNYYFRMEDLGFTLQPAVKVGTLAQEVKLDVSGKLSSPMPALPSLPGTSNPYNTLFTPAGTGSADGGGAATGAAAPTN